MFLISYALMITWFFAQTIYFTFYPISYKVEGLLNRQIKIINTLLIFANSIFFSIILYNNNIDLDENKRNQKISIEMGYLTIFIMCTLIVLNVILILNPIHRDGELIDIYQRSCCSSQNLIMTISVLFCLQVIEIHHLFFSTHQQKQYFYKPFHIVLLVWLIGLWINVQKLPERFLPHASFI